MNTLNQNTPIISASENLNIDAILSECDSAIEFTLKHIPALSGFEPWNQVMFNINAYHEATSTNSKIHYALQVLLNFAKFNYKVSVRRGRLRQPVVMEYEALAD